MYNVTTIKTASTADLLAFYNQLTGKSTSKFASREKGEAQVLRSIEESKAIESGKKSGNLVETAPGVFELAPKAVRSVAKAARVASKGTASPARATSAAKAGKPKPEPKAAKPHRHVDGKCPLCGADAGDQTAAGKEGTIAGDQRNFCHSCNKEYWVETGKEFSRAKPGKDVGASISRSWLDKDVRAARSARHSVMVGEQGEKPTEYKSVADAFRQLRLPMEKHIKFRGVVKTDGKATFEHGKKVFTFKLVK